MSTFRCVPIETTVADRFRKTGVDDGGNTVRWEIADHDGYPCRHCLRETRTGQKVLLGSYHLLRPRGIYWTPSPVFVHSASCIRYDRDNEIPEIVRNRLVSVRAYGADDMVIYGLGDVGDGREVDGIVERCLSESRTAYVNVHTARPGCLLCTIERC
jgi:hypothetical protein